MRERECDICGHSIQPGRSHTVESKPGEKDGEACQDCYEMLVEDAK